MAITKEKKKEILEKVTKIAESDSVVFANFNGVSVQDSTRMRRALRKLNLGYFVAKKTLAKKVMTEAGFTGDIPEMEGELALVYSTADDTGDLTGPAREIYAFQKEFENRIEITGGVFEKRFMNKDEMMSIAQIPSLHTLHAQVVNLFNSPIQGVVMALNAIAEKKEA